MSRKSVKLNIIDQDTYQDLKDENGDRAPKFLRNSKYKNKHKKDAQCSLFDFLVVRHKKSKQPIKKKLPHLVIARNPFTTQTKRKGKTRLHPKHRVTRLKRIIKRFRQLKLQSSENNSDGKPLEETSELSNSKQSTERIQDTNLSVPCVLEDQLEAQMEKPQQKAHKIHSRRFRSYCDNCTTKRLKELTTQLLNDLERFQKRAYANNQIKARAHPRLVVGFREALSRLRINKVKLLLLAPDCEACAEKGGLDDMIEELKSACQKQEVPYCFSLMRRELSYALHKRAQISCVAILDYDGANETYKQLIQELIEARVQYNELTST